MPKCSSSAILTGRGPRYYASRMLASVVLLSSSRGEQHPPLHCMLPTPTLFHDVPVSSAATGGKSDSYGAYHIVSIDESSFRITSLNRTFAPITATWNGSSLRAVFPNLNRSLFGVAVGSPDDSNCSLLSWRVAASAARPAQPPPPPFLRQLVYEWLPGPLPPPSAP